MYFIAQKHTKPQDSKQRGAHLQGARNEMDKLCKGNQNA